MRNEEKNILHTVKSVLDQTIKPQQWIIVDDGSTDQTAEIVNDAIKGCPWITLIKLGDRGFYDLAGGGEIKAFYQGFNLIDIEELDFIGKLDGDISFDEFYYENLMKKFDDDEKLGIASGACFHYEEEELVEEHAYYKHVRGAARLYRTACWKEIGGVINCLGWDCVDLFKARSLGWHTQSFSDLRMIHHVKTWTKGGIFHGRNRSARIEYLIGTHPLFFAFKSFRELFRKPYFILGFVYFWGFAGPWLKREKRVVDKDLMKFIRREQMSRFTIGRKR